MEVLVLIPYLYGFTPGQRSSVELWERPLKKAGINFHYSAFETDRLRNIFYKPGHFVSKAIEMTRGYIRRIQDMNDLDRYDAVLIYREAALIGPAFFEKWIARKGKPIIYQLDDPLYVPYKSSFNGYYSYLKCFGKVADICRISSAVIVNSSHHYDYVRQFNSNVSVIPSLVDTDYYRFEPNNQSTDEICIGWSGSPSTADNLQVISEALQKLSKKKRYKLHLIGSSNFNLPNISYSSQVWKSETEVEDLRKIQIGLVPLPNTEWNKRKFFQKVAQYMALGIPPVCTPLGSNPEVVEHGVTGFLAESQDEWIEYIEKLALDSSLRLKMGQNAAKVAQEKYSLDAYSDKLVEIFKSIK